MSTGTETTQPSELPSILQYKVEEIEEYEDRVGSFRDGDIPEDEFMSFRLRLGVYGQRQPDAQMFRVKIPGGLLHADQLDAIGEIAEKCDFASESRLGIIFRKRHDMTMSAYRKAARRLT